MPDFFPGASLRSQVLAHSLRMTVKPLLGVWAQWPSPLWPAGVIDHAARIVPPLRGVAHRSVRLENCAAELIDAGNLGTETVVLYLHGGGFLTCGLNTHRRLVSRISASAGAAVLSVGYRMMPKHPIRDAIADGVDGYRWLLGQGFETGKIVIAGDSAGGYLTFMTALTLVDLDLPRPAGLVALSPLTDMDPAGKLAHPGAGQCPVFPRSVLTALTGLADQDAHRDATGKPCASPVDGILEGLPPVLIQVGSTEMLYPDAELMAERLAAAGVPITLEVWDRQVHVFQAAADLIPEANHAIAQIGNFIRTTTTARTHRSHLPVETVAL
ncbi:MAG: alpha/beta hydrolase [Rhodococcus sp. (in: high G+C Gram-positive bacteria)]|nr:MAG: alpha/beta hydrolase [Rhodococcus sp. (in: high G+C Gram-positive bacteria)]